jgi:hypothetical protein
LHSRSGGKWDNIARFRLVFQILVPLKVILEFPKTQPDAPKLRDHGPIMEKEREASVHFFKRMYDLLEHAKRDNAHKHTGPHDEIRHNTDELVIPMDPEVEVSMVQEEAPVIQSNVRE